MNRNFEEWLTNFKTSIASYSYYIDFAKVYENVETTDVKINLNLLNTLIGSNNIEKDFEHIVKKYPEVLKYIPILIAVRQMDIFIFDDGIEKIFNFKNLNCSLEEYKKFMRETGLFDLLENHLVSNLVDYVMGVEVGLNSNGRKNRGGHLMEDLVEKNLIEAGFVKGETYFKEMYIEEMEKKWKIDLSTLNGNGTSTKRFDFVVKTDNMIYGIETNFYASSGSKLNEVARSYELIGKEAQKIEGFTFVWITDGIGWKSAQKNLHTTFNTLDTIYNINELEENIKKIFA